MLGISNQKGKAEQSNDTVQDAFEKGRAIIGEMERRKEPYAIHSSLSMTIHYTSGKERKRQLEIWAAYDENKKSKHLIRFTRPNNVKNTGLLTLEGENGDDYQWLYLPILRKIRRIANSSKTRNFVGTDLTYEDLRPEELDLYLYEYTGDQEIEGEPCFIVVTTPTEQEAKHSGYSKRIFFIRKDRYHPVAIHYYDKTGDLLKKQIHTEIVKIKGNLWGANRSVMENVQENRSTTLVVNKRIVSESLDEMIFSQRNLLKGY
jgi:hypothetical protein